MENLCIVNDLKFLNTFKLLFPFSNKMVIIRAVINEIVVRKFKANREDPDQTAS